MRESSHWSLKSSANWLEAEMKK